jgi:predicted LPLAT superfamily acyltransferase
MTGQSSQRVHWSGSGQLRGTPAGIRFFITAVRLLGLRFAYACAAPVAAYFSFASPDIPATIDYHRRVFGPQPRWKQRWIVCKHFFTFGLMIIDRFAILSGNLRSFSFSFDGEQYLHDAVAQGRGLVLLNAHLGNWEAGGQLLGRTKVIVNIAGFDREVAAIRGMLGEAARARFRYIKLDGSPTDVLPMLAALRRGEIVALLGDRAYGTPVTRVPFLGDLAPFPVGPYMVAALAGAPLIHVFSVREPGGHYRFLGYPPENLTAPAHAERPAFLRDCAARYAHRLEAMVRRYPLQWYNFYPFWNPPPS